MASMSWLTTWVPAEEVEENKSKYSFFFYHNLRFEKENNDFELQNVIFFIASYFFLSNFSNVVQRTELGELATLQKKTGMNWEELNVPIFMNLTHSSKVLRRKL